MRPSWLMVPYASIAFKSYARRESIPPAIIVVMPKPVTT